MRGVAQAVLCAALSLAAPAHASDYTLEQQATADFIEAHLPDAATGSDDPYTLLLGAVWSTDEQQRVQFLERALHVAPDDPIVLTQANDFCHELRGRYEVCADWDWMQRLAKAAPENGAPWLGIAAQQSIAGDREAMLAALAEAAARPYQSGYFGQATQAYYQALHRLAPAGRSFSALVVADYAFGIAAATVSLEAQLMFSCREMQDDTRVLHLCRKIASQMIDKPSTVASMVIAAGILRRVPDPSQREVQRIALVDDLMARVDEVVAARDARWRADPSLIEQTIEAMALHGEYRAWWQ